MAARPIWWLRALSLVPNLICDSMASGGRRNAVSENFRRSFRHPIRAERFLWAENIGPSLRFLAHFGLPRPTVKCGVLVPNNPFAGSFSLLAHFSRILVILTGASAFGRRRRYGGFFFRPSLA